MAAKANKSKRLRKTNSKTRTKADATKASASASPHRTPPSIQAKDTAKTSFAVLPPELRNIIYAYALTPSHGDPIYLAGGRATAADLALSLLAACKAVRKEARDTLYIRGTFRVDFGRLTTRDWSERERRRCRGEMDEYRHFYPCLYETLRLLGPRAVSRTRSWLFVYHDGSPSGPLHGCGIPIKGTLAWRLDLLAKRPFCRLQYDGGYMSRVLGKLEQAWLRSPMRYVMHEIAHGPVRGLTVRDVLRFAEWFRQYCQSACDGTMRSY